jgi:hypothetical protein
MIAPGNSIIQLVLALAFVIASGYASGRIHQWYKHGLERDHAFREGYDRASQSMFEMAVHSGQRKRAIAPSPSPGPQNKREPIGERRTVRLMGTTGHQRDASAAGQAPTPGVGSSRRRIVPHIARPMTGRRRRHAA